jgi:uncharacterized protein (DUF433 family)/DNA-binding transcriptional MerR regulator
MTSQLGCSHSGAWPLTSEEDACSRRLVGGACKQHRCIMREVGAMTPRRFASPRGWYLAAEVGQLVGVSGDRIGQWARHGYIRSSQSTGSPRIYSFQDVAEAMAVHELLRRGVRHDEIRRAIENLREQYGDWPLTEAPLGVTTYTHGRKRETLLLGYETTHYEVGRGHGRQLVLSVHDLQYINVLLRRGGWAIRELPDVEHIQVDPDRLSGRPTIRNRRLPVGKVAELAKSGFSGLRILRADYELERPEIVDAVRWYDAVIRYEQAA